MLLKLYPLRFQILFFSLIMAIFGPIILPHPVYYKWVGPIIFLLNICTSFLLSSQNIKKLITLFCLFICALFLYTNFKQVTENIIITYSKYSIGFLFYLIVSLELIKQIWSSKNVNNHTLFGLAAGYISLGLGGYFIYEGVELYQENSFSGLLVNEQNEVLKEDSLLYFSLLPY